MYGVIVSAISVTISRGSERTSTVQSDAAVHQRQRCVHRERNGVTTSARGIGAYEIRGGRRRQRGRGLFDRTNDRTCLLNFIYIMTVLFKNIIIKL